MSGKPRIAILGGGAGGVTAALQLSKPGWERHFDSITLYQQGWRLGGKGACGRGRDLRIEEHGLHVWFGFYENAFRLLHGCHEELDRRARDDGQPRWPLPFSTVAESFTRVNEIALADYDGCDWKLWVADFFDELADTPWSERPAGTTAEPPLSFYLGRALRLAADAAWSLAASEPRLEVAVGSVAAAREGATDVEDALGGLLAALGGGLPGFLGAAADVLDALAEEAFADPPALRALDHVLRALDVALDALRRAADPLAREVDAVRRAYYVVDLMIAIVRGVIEDGVLEAEDFDVVDDVDLRDWLLAHGAMRETVECALIRGLVYDLGFAYEDGDPRRPACAAGTALRGLMRAFFTFRGSLMWRMNAGMGDVVFLPFYELLVKRNVDVRFFHRLEDLRVRDGRVEEIEIDVQARVPPDIPPTAYATPAASGLVGTLGWPSDPPAIVSSPAGMFGAAAVDGETYESWYGAREAARAETKILRCGAADGFDLVVFGLPISCVPHVASRLIESSPRWERAVDYIRTVPTQAMQLWLDVSPAELEGVGRGMIASGFVEPFDSWADMSHLIPREQVPGSEAVIYFCNVLADSAPPARGRAEGWRAAQKALVRFQAERFLNRDLGALWPDVVHPVTNRFDWRHLIDPSDGHGPRRLDAQYLRANVEPSERYVLSVPGSSRYRIAPDDTGVENLYAVGDWTACGLNAGCVEGAVVSGMVAANAIHRTYGDPARADAIIGFEGLSRGVRDGG